MVIKKRPASITIKPKPSKKADKFRAMVTDLCNRLQAPGGAHDVFLELVPHIDCSYSDPRDMLHVAMDLAARCDTTIKTLQLNHEAGHTAYQVEMHYTNRKEEPAHGWYRPTKYAVISSPSLVLAVTLAYLAVSKQVGHFI